MSEDSKKLLELHNKLVAVKATVEQCLNLLMEVRTAEHAQSQLPPPGRLTPAQAVEYVTKRLPEEWVPDLVVQAGVDGVVTVKAKQWMEKGWREVDAAVSTMGGVWITAGKASAWRIPSKGGPLT